jgi:sugar lactone lactonase YvrE
VSVGSAGNVYVADNGNFTIRKVTSAGVVTTLAGSPEASGSVDGTGSAARFYRPQGAAVDSAGDVFVADYGNYTIRKITSAGVVTTLAGSAGYPGTNDGAGSAARFYHPMGVAVDGAGNVSVADTDNHTIRRITSGGVVTTLAGSAGESGSDDGTGSAARFGQPDGVAADSAGNVYVADSYYHTIRKVTSSGVVTTLAGSAGYSGNADGTGSAAQFYNPTGVAVDSTGDLYVADYGNHTIRQVTSAGVVTTLAGTAGQSGSADGTGGEARFHSPNGVAVDSADNVYVADLGNSTIRKVTSAGVVTTIGGCVGVASSADGAGSSALFAAPTGIAVDSTGRLYVSDSGNNRISKGTLVAIIAITGSGNSVTLSWPSPTTGLLLQQNCDACNASGWQSSGYTITDDGTNKSITVRSPTGGLFFRLVGN